MAAIVETMENEKSDLLKTHYYKASYEEIKKVYLKALKSLGHKVLSDNDTYGEIFSELELLSVTAKIIQQSPKETSIDFYVVSDYSLMASKKALKFIQDVYKKIEEKFELKGLALHI